MPRAPEIAASIVGLFSNLSVRGNRQFRNVPAQFDRMAQADPCRPFRSVDSNGGPCPLTDLIDRVVDRSCWADNGPLIYSSPPIRGATPTANAPPSRGTGNCG